MIQVGWVVDSSPKRVLKLPWQRLSSVGLIRYGQLACYLNEKSEFKMSLYRPLKKYDIVVFVKMMNRKCQALAEKLKRSGTVVIFDANVNYYDVSGEYKIPGTKPTLTQNHDAIAMTQLASCVIADSTYLQTQCQKFNAHVSWIPDAVDTDFYAPKSSQRMRAGDKLRCVWSGMGKKAQCLDMLESIFDEFSNQLSLTVVTSPNSHKNPWPDVLERMSTKQNISIHYYNYESYPLILNEADVIISPRMLENSYEKAHTEYKITLGMSVGLPAVVSPQQSYIDALSKNKCGWICHTLDDWRSTFNMLISGRVDLQSYGAAARSCVIENYSIPVVAEKYAKVLRNSLLLK